MEYIKQLLEKPFNGLKQSDVSGINQKCMTIANDLFNKYCIKCCDKDNKETEYYFAEIEFYYWDKNEWNLDWNKVTYNRDNYDVGELMFHPSGIDICFKSSYDSAMFGGILVRSVMDKDGIITAGPWNSMLQILNTCKGGKMPKFAKASHRNHIPNIKSTYRSLGKDDMKMEEQLPLKLCLYDAVPADKWNFVKESFNKDDFQRKQYKVYYNKNRFSL